MEKTFILIFTLFSLQAMAATLPAADKTLTGIPLNTTWKRSIYEFARQNVVHPAWGLTHSERDYQITVTLARREKIQLDEEVLFAAAFLHDLGGLPAYAIKNVDHALRSVQVIEPLLGPWGFPMEKWPQVKEMILGHTYYGPIPDSLPARAFRDADVLDFIGDIGISRILSITQDPEHPSPTLKPMVDTLKDFVKTMPTKCLLHACKLMAIPRTHEMQRFLTRLERESFEGAAY